MKRILVTLVVFVLCLVPLRADLTFTQTMTMEGPMAAAMAGKPVVTVMHVKGKKARADMEVMDTTMSTLTDLATKEVLLINHKERTVQVITASTQAPPEMPKLDINVSLKPTGQSRPIDGVACDEHAFKLSLGFAEMSGKQVPPEAAAMLKDVRMLMDGSIWIARTGPGAAEYMAFQKAATDANLAAMFSGFMGGGANRGGGMDKLMAAMSEAPGLPYLTEISMSVEGSGPMVEMMKSQMAGMKMIQKTTSVTTDAVSDDIFKVPADYTVKK